MSATSSGGVSSIVSLIVSTICVTDGSIASRIWSAPTSTRARQAGQQVAAAERDALRVPLARVRGPDGDLDVLRGPLAEEQVVLAPGVRDDVLVHLVAADRGCSRLTTMPPRLMTATSVVPPPMSTMRLPDGSLTGSPAPIAAAIGSSMRRAQRAPALRAASRTARFSTSVTPDGMPSSIRGRGIEPDPVVHLVDEVLDHLLGDVEVADDAVTERPDRDDVGGRPADHALRLGADREHPLGPRVDRDDATAR